MKKKIILRTLLGFPLGVAIGYLLTIFFSLCFANGYYSPCEPELVKMLGNEINAVILQTALCGLLGIGFSVGSVIWEVERWSIVKQTGVYFLIVSLIMMPLAYLMYWMEHSVKGFFSYFGIFIFVFIIIWIISFIIGKYNIKRMNANLYKAKNDKYK